MHISAALPLLLRLRGGADIPDGTGTSTGLRLSREEITAKLNRVPTFCIMQGDGSVISLPDPAGAEGDECCTWFLDAAEAQSTGSGGEIKFEPTAGTAESATPSTRRWCPSRRC